MNLQIIGGSQKGGFSYVVNNTKLELLGVSLTSHNPLTVLIPTSELT